MSAHGASGRQGRRALGHGFVAGDTSPPLPQCLAIWKEGQKVDVVALGSMLLLAMTVRKRRAGF